MPALPLEQYVFPNNLFAQFADISQAGDRWWVLHCRPRAEKALSRRLLGRNLRFFLPLYKKQRRSNGRSVCAYHPLFSNYLFLHGDAQTRLNALETNMVVRVLDPQDQDELHSDLMRVHQLMLTGSAPSPEERLQPGMYVEIVSGPFQGMEGKILKRNNSMRFLVEVRFLQQGVCVDIEDWMIQPLSRPRAELCTAGNAFP